MSVDQGGPTALRKMVVFRVLHFMTLYLIRVLTSVMGLFGARLSLHYWLSVSLKGSQCSSAPQPPKISNIHKWIGIDGVSYLDDRLMRKCNSLFKQHVFACTITCSVSECLSPSGWFCSKMPGAASCEGSLPMKVFWKCRQVACGSIADEEIRVSLLFVCFDSRGSFHPALFRTVRRNTVWAAWLVLHQFLHPLSHQLHFKQGRHHSQVCLIIKLSVKSTQLYYLLSKNLVWQNS